MDQRRVSVHDSALKHSIAEEDSLHALRNSAFSAPLDDENPQRELRLGFDRAGRLLELVVLIFDSGNMMIIHSMRARAKYLPLLE